MDNHVIVVLDCPYHDNSTVLGIFTDWNICFNAISNTQSWIKYFTNEWVLYDGYQQK